MIKRRIRINNTDFYFCNCDNYINKADLTRRSAPKNISINRLNHFQHNLCAYPETVQKFLAVVNANDCNLSTLILIEEFFDLKYSFDIFPLTYCRDASGPVHRCPLFVHQRYENLRYWINDSKSYNKENAVKSGVRAT